MATVRCQKHDVVFETVTDHRLPGAKAQDNFDAHPTHCHPDCPQGRKEKSEKPTVAKSAVNRVSNV